MDDYSRPGPVAVVSFVMLLFAGGGNPILSAIIGIVSALPIMVDFNYLRQHGTQGEGCGRQRASSCRS